VEPRSRFCCVGVQASNTNQIPGVSQFLQVTLMVWNIDRIHLRWRASAQEHRPSRVATVPRASSLQCGDCRPGSLSDRTNMTRDSATTMRVPTDGTNGALLDRACSRLNKHQGQYRREQQTTGTQSVPLQIRAHERLDIPWVLGSIGKEACGACLKPRHELP